MTDIIQAEFNDDQATIEELEQKILLMKEDKERKCKAAKEQLVNMLDVTVDKYLTATGTAEALRVLRFVGEDAVKYLNLLQTKMLIYANRLAKEMAMEVKSMKAKAEKLSYAKMDQLCDGFYEKKFDLSKKKTDDIETVYALAFEMMRIDLCRNVGGATEDIVGFIKRTEEEIDSIGEELKRLKEGE